MTLPGVETSRVRSQRTSTPDETDTMFEPQWRFRQPTGENRLPEYALIVGDSWAAKHEWHRLYPDQPFVGSALMAKRQHHAELL